MNGNGGNATATRKTGVVAVDFYRLTCANDGNGNGGNANFSAINAYARARATEEIYRK